MKTEMYNREAVDLRHLELLELVPDAIVIGDADGRIEWVNKHAVEMFGFSRPELVGRPLEILLPEDAESQVKFLERYRDALGSRLMDSSLELEAKRKDGSRIPVDFSFNPARTADSDIVIAAIREVSDRRRASRKLEESERRLNAVLEAAPFGAIVFELTGQNGFRVVNVNYAAARLLHTTEADALGKTVGDVVPGPASATIEHALRSVSKGAGRYEEKQVPYQHRYGECVLEVYAARVGDRRVAVFLRNVSEMVEAYEEALLGWSRAMDFRDRETEGHTQRVTEMTVRLARRLGVPEEDIVHMRRGAMLHDIGKMGVPDHVLLKPGPLTDEEWVVMRKHPEYALEMLIPISFLGPALDIPYCHHEKWDGSGYPNGLAGEDIPLAARIFAVADVWDAMSADRPYRRGMRPDEVRDFITRQSGRHFDPRVVEVFLRLISEESS